MVIALLTCCGVIFIRMAHRDAMSAHLHQSAHSSTSTALRKGEAKKIEGRERDVDPFRMMRVRAMVVTYHWHHNVP